MRNVLRTAVTGQSETATDWTMEFQLPGQTRIILALSQRQDRLCHPPNVLAKLYRGKVART
jgi:hypothetical protein